jgi:predicted nucleotide-binding protein
LGIEQRTDELVREMQTLQLRVALAVDRGMPASELGSGGSSTGGMETPASGRGTGRNQLYDTVAEAECFTGLGAEPRASKRGFREEWMDKPRIFLGSSGKQAKLLQALTRGLEDVAHVEPWTTSFNPGTTTLDRLVELAHEVDFAAFVFARDDWTSTSPAASPSPETGQDSPRDNVVFEAGLFGGVLGMGRTFILHARGSKLPSDLLGLTCVRYGDVTTTSEMRAVNQKVRKAIENEGRVARIEGLWWQFSLTALGPREPSAVSLLRISRDRDGALELVGRSWQEDGSLSARYWSEAVRERKEPSGVFYYWKGERPRDLNAPQLDGTGEILMESADRAAGYFTTRADTRSRVNARTAGVYCRAEPEDMSILDGRDERQRAALISERLRLWRSITSA